MSEATAKKSPSSESTTAIGLMAFFLGLLRLDMTEGRGGEGNQLMKK